MPPLALVSNPDRPAGRKQLLTPPPTKALITNRHLNSISILQPEHLDAVFLNSLSRLRPDFLIVAAYGKIIPKEILAIPPRGAIGVHFSLLPKYRGPSPLQTAILNGETESGVSLYLLDEKVDAGPLLAQRRLSIAGYTYQQLVEKFAHTAAEMLIQLLPEFIAEKIKPLPQDHTQATFTRKFTAADARVEPLELEMAEAGDKEKAETILRKIRALSPEPGVWTMRGGKRIKLLDAEIQGNKLVLRKIQLEGQKPKYIQ